MEGRVYLSIKKGFVVDVEDNGKAGGRGGRVNWIETRTLDQFAAVIEEARRQCKEQGIPTSPTAAKS